MSLTADEQDAHDMSRLAKGQEAALNDLMERHAQRLFQYLLRSLQNESDAADLAQETFVRVYQNRARFDAHHKFSTWLYAILLHRYQKSHAKLPEYFFTHNMRAAENIDKIESEL